MTKRTRIPSGAQAKLLARKWGDDRCVTAATNINDEIHLSVRVCVRNGWLVSTGQGGNYPNGMPFEVYEVSPAGLAALGEYLRRLRKDTE